MITNNDERRNRTKACCELLINDYTRRGFVDGRVARLPTVIPRPERRGMEVKLPCAGARKILLEYTRGAEVNLRTAQLHSAAPSTIEVCILDDEHFLSKNTLIFRELRNVKICEGSN